ANQRAARIGDLQAQRHAFELAAPVLAANDRSGADLFAGPIDAAVGEQISGEGAAVGVAFHAADLESRQIVRAAALLERQERTVAAEPCQVQHRLTLALETLQLRKADMTFG